MYLHHIHPQSLLLLPLVPPTHFPPLHILLPRALFLSRPFTVAAGMLTALVGLILRSYAATTAAGRSPVQWSCRVLRTAFHSSPSYPPALAFFLSPLTSLGKTDNDVPYMSELSKSWHFDQSGVSLPSLVLSFYLHVCVCTCLPVCVPHA